MSENFQTTNKGEAVNALEAACRKWHKCNQCTQIDNQVCLGYQQTYGKADYDSKNKVYRRGYFGKVF